MTETKADLRKAAGKTEAIELICKALGFSGEAGKNYDALYDVLTAWSSPVRVHLLYYSGFARRLPGVASALTEVIEDAMYANRNVIFAFK